MPRIALPYSDPATLTNMSLTTTSLATYVFTHNPKTMSSIRKKRTSSTIKTLDSNAFMDWSFPTEQEGLIGYVAAMSWPFMKRTDFDRLKAYYESTEIITFDAQRFAHNTVSLYEVEFVTLEADDMPQNITHVTNVTVSLEIRKVKAR